MGLNSSGLGTSVKVLLMNYLIKCMAFISKFQPPVYPKREDQANTKDINRK